MEKQNFNTHLYFIRDRLSGAAETAVIQALNDAVAVRGFQQFLVENDKQREAQNMPLIGRIERELVHICALDENNHVICATEDHIACVGLHEIDYRVVCNGENVENYLEEVRNGLREDD